MKTELEMQAASLVGRYFGEKTSSVTPLGGGFYGRVFLAELSRKPYKAVVKISLFNGMGKREATQLKLLSCYSLIKMPEVYFVHEPDEEIPFDALIMEYIEGINAGLTSDIAPNHRDRIAWQIVENLAAWHSVVHAEGFGEIEAERFEKDWRVWYREKACSVVRKAKDLLECGKISPEVFGTVERAFENYHGIFSDTVEKARLIHGDYNTWNILLDKDATRAVAVIDPLGCRWADRELDLYQLDNANGRAYGLLDKYKSVAKVNARFEIKLCFYELFSEIMHYYDANIDMRKSNIPEEALRMKALMDKYGL